MVDLGAETRETKSKRDVLEDIGIVPVDMEAFEWKDTATSSFRVEVLKYPDDFETAEDGGPEFKRDVVTELFAWRNTTIFEELKLLEGLLLSTAEYSVVPGSPDLSCLAGIPKSRLPESNDRCTPKVAEALKLADRTGMFKNNREVWYTLEFIYQGEA